MHLLRLPPDPAAGPAKATVKGSAEAAATGSSEAAAAKGTAKPASTLSAAGGGAKAVLKLAEQHIVDNGSSGDAAPLQLPIMSSLNHLLGTPVAPTMAETATPASQPKVLGNAHDLEARDCNPDAAAQAAQAPCQPSPALAYTCSDMPTALNLATAETTAPASQDKAVGKLIAEQVAAPPSLPPTLPLVPAPALRRLKVFGKAEVPKDALDLAAKVLPKVAATATPAKLLADALDLPGLPQPSPALALADNDELPVQAKALPPAAATTPAPAASSQANVIVGGVLDAEAMDHVAPAVWPPAPGNPGDSQDWTDGTWPVSGLPALADEPPSEAEVMPATASTPAGSALASQAKVSVDETAVGSESSATPAAVAQEVQGPSWPGQALASASSEELLAQAKALPPTEEAAPDHACDDAFAEEQMAVAATNAAATCRANANMLRVECLRRAGVGEDSHCCGDSKDEGADADLQERAVKAEVAVATAMPAASALASQAEIEGASWPSPVLVSADNDKLPAQAKVLPPVEAAAPASAALSNPAAVAEAADGPSAEAKKVFPPTAAASPSQAKEAEEAKDWSPTTPAPKRRRFSHDCGSRTKEKDDSKSQEGVKGKEKASAKEVEAAEKKTGSEKEGAKGTEVARTKQVEAQEKKTGTEKEGGKGKGKARAKQIEAQEKKTGTRKEGATGKEKARAKQVEAEDKKTGTGKKGAKGKEKSRSKQVEAKEKKTGTGKKGVQDSKGKNNKKERKDNNDKDKEEKAPKRLKKEKAKVKEEKDYVEEGEKDDKEVVEKLEITETDEQMCQQVVDILVSDFRRNLATQEPPFFFEAAQGPIDAAIVEGRVWCSGRMYARRAENGEYWVQLEKRTIGGAMHCVACLKFLCMATNAQKQLLSFKTSDPAKVCLLALAFESLKCWMAEQAPADCDWAHKLLMGMFKHAIDWVDDWAQADEHLRRHRVS
jgi:hypothetical protein